MLIFIFKCAGLDVENNEFLFLKSGDGDFNGFIDGIVANFYSLYDFILSIFIYFLSIFYLFFFYSLSIFLSNFINKDC
jgi:hypothetical protein